MNTTAGMLGMNTFAHHLVGLLHPETAPGILNALGVWRFRFMGDEEVDAKNLSELFKFLSSSNIKVLTHQDTGVYHCDISPTVVVKNCVCTRCSRAMSFLTVTYVEETHEDEPVRTHNFPCLACAAHLTTVPSGITFKLIHITCSNLISWSQRILCSPRMQLVKSTVTRAPSVTSIYSPLNADGESVTKEAPIVIMEDELRHALKVSENANRRNICINFIRSLRGLTDTDLFGYQC
jgi:hypothetical protein